ncbi:hypothetical protein C7M84_015603 [Penaeus vannamei]|uniref:Ubiquitin-like protease family profile domain-containing protein n=1 Tax=Penaeus vannamei TaxID=6689 RepID=A0A423SQC8_PENVA|nr:hypothetical protein C7M84_015603 [Penaeus vannamei]
MVQRGPGVVGPVNQSPQVQQGTTNDEVRIPLSTNNTLNEQYYYVQRADGSRILAVVSLNQGASNTTAQQSNTSTVTTMAGSQTPHMSSATVGANSVSKAKPEEGLILNSSTVAKSTSLQVAPTNSSRVVSPSNPPVSIAAKTPPLQEQTVHSTVSTEQTDAEGTGGGVRKGVEKKPAPVLNQKAKGRGRGRGKTYEEPVILTLSSDEEEDDKRLPGAAGVAGNGVFSNLEVSHPKGPPEPISHKEPIITLKDDVPKEDSSGGVTGGGLPDLSSLDDGTIKGSFTSIQCRSIRIGSYKVMPKERVVIASQGLRLKLPTVIEDSSEPVSFDIPIKSIVKILVHFGRSLPVLFIYVRPSTAANIRRILKMSDRNGFYFDPCSYDESQKRITILPDKMSEETKSLVKEILSASNPKPNGGLGTSTTSVDIGANLYEELDQKEANEILVRSSPMESLIKKTPVASGANETKTLLIYPPPPQKGGISITTDDYCCLEEEQFLNDVIIDFYLKWLLQSKLPEIHRSHTHVFSTFFYKRLTSKPKRGRRPHTTEDDPKLSPAEKRHARVKSWTKNVDIFEKDFIIIPINEHAHWFLAIICFPGLDSPIRICDGQPVARPISEKPKRRRSTRPKNRIEIPIIDDGEWSDRDEAEGEEDELEEEEEEEDVPATKKNKLEAGKAEEAQGPKEAATPPPAIKQPCILIFDSLTGANRSRIVATLRDYLAVEHKIRRGSEKLFNRDTMKGACPRVPQQMNYSDCGIYTLQFAESFFEHPLKDYTFPIRSLTEWFPHEVVRGKREAMAKLIRNLMEQHNPNHSSITLPDIYFSSDDKKDKGGTSTAHASDASQPQKEVSGQGKPGDSKTPEVQLKKEQERVIIKDGVLTQVEGSGREQNHRMDMSSSAEVVTSLPNNDNTACIKVNRVTPSKITPTKSPTVNPAMSKSSSSYTPVKTLPNSSNIITSQVNSVKFQGTTYSQAKAIPSSRVGDATIVHETQSPQVNNVRRQMVYSSDDAIFPVKVDQKKVPMRENNAAQLSETHQGTEVSSKKIESVMTGSLGVDKVGNPVKAVESSGQTAIIDEDTAEVLLIMPAKNQTSGQIPRTAKKQLENSSPEDDSIMIEEGPGFGGYVTADRRPMKNSLSSGMPKMGAVGGAMSVVT